jgi:hypothetical protein
VYTFRDLRNQIVACVPVPDDIDPGVFDRWVMDTIERQTGRAVRGFAYGHRPRPVRDTPDSDNTFRRLSGQLW